MQVKLHCRKTRWGTIAPFLAAVCLVQFPTANAQSMQYSGQGLSIREQLQGNVEYQEKQGTTQLQGMSSLEGLSTFSKPDNKYRLFKGETDSQQLRGRVEERDRLGKLQRMNADLLIGKSVKVLSGRNYNQALEGRAENETFDSALSASNFNLPSRKLNKMAPKSDYNDLSNTYADMHSKRYLSQPGFAWGIGEWMINDWGIGYGGYGYDLDCCGGYYKRLRSLRGSMDWDSLAMRQERVRADLKLDPNFYNRPYQNPSIIPSIKPFSRNLNWGIAPMSMPETPYAETNILWDAWYQSISRELYRHWQSRGDEPGEATLRITVRRPRKIEAQIIRCNNQSETFKRGLMAAVTALNGSPVLEFPMQSQKQVVSFNSAFSASPGTKSGAYSERSGELEKIRTYKK